MAEPPDVSVDALDESLREIGGSVHTYESFGRAIVSHVVQKMAAQGGAVSDRSVEGRFSVKPIVRRSATDAPTAHCAYVCVTFDVTEYCVVACVVIPEVEVGTI